MSVCTPSLSLSHTPLMEFESVLQFLENKTILITGATGFLAKIFLEKILRIQPNVKQLFLLLRAPDAKSATQRFDKEVIEKELFRVVREKYGVNDLNSLISKKVTPIAGDISCEDMGVIDFNLKQTMWKEIDIVLNLAATTNFDERYDVALGINVLGSKHVLNFAKKCVKLNMFLHVSTAYVCGERDGIILEKPFDLGESLNGKSGLDIDVEIQLMQEKMSELEADGATEGKITQAMKDFGILRANMYGWPNTYVFTKAMGEMLVRHYKDSVPLVILRPTIITSTYKEPFPGWIEGVRTMDSFVVGYAKGRMTCLLGDPNSLIDAIPADMVVNSIMVAVAANTSKSGDIIYQVGSSLGNPLKFSNLQYFIIRYFTENPWMNKDGKPIKVGKVTVLSTMARFHRYIAIRYLPLLKGLQLVNSAFCQAFRGTYIDLSRKINFVVRMAELYRPYVFFKGIFDDKNIEKLRMAVHEESCVDVGMFYFDPKCIDWEDYFMNIHIPGVVKYVFK